MLQKFTLYLLGDFFNAPKKTFQNIHSVFTGRIFFITDRGSKIYPLFGYVLTFLLVLYYIIYNIYRTYIEHIIYIYIPYILVINTHRTYKCIFIRIIKIIKIIKK
jgi:hypothetical protein